MERLELLGRVLERLVEEWELALEPVLELALRLLWVELQVSRLQVEKLLEGLEEEVAVKQLLQWEVE